MPSGDALIEAEKDKRTNDHGIWVNPWRTMVGLVAQHSGAGKVTFGVLGVGPNPMMERPLYVRRFV